jgi:arginase
MTYFPESISKIVVPYHVGVYNHRVGAGPLRILENNLVTRLEALGKTVATTTIPSVDSFKGEIRRSFELIRRTSTAVSLAVKANSFPIILAGNCNTSVGVAAGLTEGTGDFEVVWFDAHPDLANTDETTSGYFDGSGVSMWNGECWKALLATVPGINHLGWRKSRTAVYGI